MLKKRELISSRKSEVEIKEIKKLANDLFKFDGRFKNRISNDVSRIERDTGEEDNFDWKTYNEFYGEYGKQADLRKHGKQQPDLRNFLAHSGFERNMVQLKKFEGKVYLKYEDSMINTIKRFCAFSDQN